MMRFVLTLMFALLYGAAYGQVAPALQCTLNAAVPPSIPVEKLDALTGELVLSCTGGTPTAAGSPVPQTNIQLFLNTNLTSRIDGADNSEVLLLVDEPAPAAQLFCGAPGPCAMQGTGTGAGTYDGSAGRFNVFQGHRTGPNSVAWTGVPIDPPGLSAVRTMRVVNVRANANALGLSGTQIPTQVVAFMSATGGVSPGINNPQQTVGFVVAGESFSVRTADGALTGGLIFPRDAEHNTALALNGSATGCVDFRLRYAELFQTAFLVRNAAGGGAAPPVAQNVPGTVYATETGFYNPAFPLLGGAPIGLADHGTRLIARFDGVPTGVRLFVSTTPVSTTGAITAAMTAAAADGSGGFSPVTGTASIQATCPDITAGTLAEVPLASGAGYAVWEVTGAGAAAAESLDVAVVAAWLPNDPALGTSTVRGGYAPVSAVGVASTTAPNPRFADVLAENGLLAIVPAAIATAVPMLAPGALGALALVLFGVAALRIARRARAAAATNRNQQSYN